MRDVPLLARIRDDEVIDRVRVFVEMEERSGTPIQITPENIARLCCVSVEEAALALKELGR